MRTDLDRRPRRTGLQLPALPSGDDPTSSPTRGSSIAHDAGSPLALGRATRRAERAEQTRRRILDAATALFTAKGYSSTTIESIAAQADVAVETVYSRFRNKANILDAILGPAIVGSDNGRGLFDLAEIAEIRQCGDQGTQIRLLARFSRGVLERTQTAHRILQTAAASDPNAAELQRLDTARRCEGQRAYIDMLFANGPLLDGLNADDAAGTYSALANPTTYTFLIVERGWSPGPI